MTVEERLEQVERDLAVLAEARAARGVADELRARRFVLEDAGGTARPELGVDEDEPGLALRDEKGTLRAVLGPGQAETPDGRVITHPESSLRLFGPHGRGIWSAP